jgi:hypothetical protein
MLERVAVPDPSDDHCEITARMLNTLLRLAATIADIIKLILK